ncbi:1-acyl-sn-glycerol-3-phosphate acyltransferase [Caenimonas sp. SL110]|uniref:lysophospholipid acyltransferase family protein n=1 Tax=Caenimonas sp. SL110 TaxID=1450524 RepID=UPI0006530CAC|nr:lysophospholipid acyltransferase family protein [Caenimonas sp. SL110]
MKSLRAAWKLMRALVHGIAGLLTITLLFPRMSQVEREARVQAWSLEMLKVLGIKLEVHGGPPAGGPLLLVANHISWLDILVMHAARYCRFVSKADVKDWPLIGMLATGGGTIYIERASRRDAMRVVHRITESLKAGEVVAVFPEGTTSDGKTLLPFHANLIQAAISAQAPVQPVSLDYLDAKTREISFGALYIDDDTLVGSLWRALTSPPITAVVNFGEPQTHDGRNRRAWAEDLRSAVNALRQP